jgi:hypothetical protein
VTEVKSRLRRVYAVCALITCIVALKSTACAGPDSERFRMRPSDT